MLLNKFYTVARFPFNIIYYTVHIHSVISSVYSKSDKSSKIYILAQKRNCIKQQEVWAVLEMLL